LLPTGGGGTTEMYNDVEKYEKISMATGGDVCRRRDRRQHVVFLMLTRWLMIWNERLRRVCPRRMW
jgi:hypothetical protein